MSIPGAEELKSFLLESEAGAVAPEKISWLAALVDHTALKTDVTEAQLIALCREARNHHFGAVCVRVNHVAFCVQQLAGTNVKTVSVVGFPTGTESTAVKAAETREAIQRGAAEIDMVLNVPALQRGDLGFISRDIAQVVEAAGGRPVKVILETCLLERDEKIIAAALAKAAGAAFLKTSTGFSSGGATVEDVALLRSVAKQSMGVKASGGVRNLSDALRMVLAGADRIGTSGGVEIMSGKSSRGGESRVY